MISMNYGASHITISRVIKGVVMRDISQVSRGPKRNLAIRRRPSYGTRAIWEAGENL